jgi:general stress protein 26
MGEVKNLSREEATKKLKELAEDVNTCMFCTNLGNAPFETRPMATQQVDDLGNFWFFSSVNSHKNIEIKQDDHVQLIYAKNSDSHYLSVYGKATILKDAQKAKEIWNKWAEAWFKEGPTDPNLTLIKVTPQDAYYWDTKDGQVISLMKIAISAVTGKQMDGGVEGKINV